MKTSQKVFALYGLNFFFRKGRRWWGNAKLKVRSQTVQVQFHAACDTNRFLRDLNKFVRYKAFKKNIDLIQFILKLFKVAIKSYLYSIENG